MSLIQKFADQQYKECIFNFDKSARDLFSSLKFICSMQIQKRNPSLYKDVISTIETTQNNFAKYFSKLIETKDVNVFNAANKSIIDLVQFFRNPKLYNASSEDVVVMFRSIQESYKSYLNSYNECKKHF